MEKTHQLSQRTRVKAPFWAQVSSPQTHTSLWTASLFCCSGRETCASSRQKTPCATRVPSPKRSGMNGLAKSGRSKAHAKPKVNLERRTAAYPEEIADRLIRMFSVKGEFVLDPFLGSGTTTKVAIAKRDASSIGYESDKNLLASHNQKNCQQQNPTVHGKNNQTLIN